MKRLIAETSIEFNGDLQPFIINGYDILPLNDEYINVAKKILVYIPILPTSERIYYVALYLCNFDLDDIYNDLDLYIDKVTDKLKQDKLLNDKAQTTRRLTASIDNLYEVQKQIDNAIYKKFHTHEVYLCGDELVSRNEIQDLFDSECDEDGLYQHYYNFDEYLQINGYAKFDIYKKVFNDEYHLKNFLKKNKLTI